jgi:ferric enterobactin receptor
MTPSTTAAPITRTSPAGTSRSALSADPGRRLAIGILTALLWAVLPGTTGAQVPTAAGRISGQVITADGQPLENVGITLRSAADSAVVSGALTDRTGRFRIDGLRPGGYLLRVSALGYKPRNSEVIELAAASPQLDMGVIELEVSAVELDAIEAAAERDAVVIESDRTTYNVKAMPVAASGTVTDVLRSVPELEVDINGNVKMRGNQAVAVHVNGRPAPMQGEQLATFLQQLQGNRVDRVEVLPNPSAKYDPEGMGGIVNIVLKENSDLGLSGSLNATATTPHGWRSNGRLNYHKGRLTLFSGAGIGAQRWNDRSDDTRRNLVMQPITVVDQDSRMVRRMPHRSVDWTAELKVGRQAHLWSNGYVSSASTNSDGSTAYRITSGNVVRDSHDQLDTTGGGFDVFRLGGGFKQVFEARREEFTVDFTVFDRDDVSNLVQERLIRIRSGASADLPREHLLNDIDRSNRNITAQADYFRPFGSGRLELGLSSWQRLNANDNRLFNTRQATAPDLHSGYDYAETVTAAYTTLSRTLGKFSAQAGLRLEHTATTFESRVADASFDQGYMTLFPSFNVMYSPRAGRSARLLYSRRIGRPGAFYLDPFVPSTDPLSISLGNPRLQPTYADSYRADLTWTGSRGTMRIAPYYLRTSNIWEQIRTVDLDAVATNMWMNGSHASTVGSNFTLSLPSAGRVSGSATANLRHHTRDGRNIAADLQRTAVLWSAGANLMARVTGTMTAQFSGDRFSPSTTLQGRNPGWSYSTFALRQQVLGNKGSISLNVNDPLRLSSAEVSTRSHATYTQTSTVRYQTRSATLGFTYSFGRTPQQQSRRPAEETGETIRTP